MKHIFRYVHLLLLVFNKLFKGIFMNICFFSLPCRVIVAYNTGRNGKHCFYTEEGGSQRQSRGTTWLTSKKLTQTSARLMLSTTKSRVEWRVTCYFLEKYYHVSNNSSPLKKYFLSRNTEIEIWLQSLRL